MVWCADLLKHLGIGFAGSPVLAFVNELLEFIDGIRSAWAGWPRQAMRDAACNAFTTS